MSCLASLVFFCFASLGNGLGSLGSSAFGGFISSFTSTFVLSDSGSLALLRAPPEPFEWPTSARSWFPLSAQSTAGSSTCFTAHRCLPFSSLLAETHCSRCSSCLRKSSSTGSIIFAAFGWLLTAVCVVVFAFLFCSWADDFQVCSHPKSSVQAVSCQSCRCKCKKGTWMFRFQ